MIGSTPRKWRSDGSPVNGDVHAGFCGGPGGEIPPGYPTTHICARSRKGKFTVRVRTARKRMKRAMRRVAEWCQRNRHLPVEEQHKVLIRILRGHYAYYGRRGNLLSLSQFFRFVKKIWHKWLQRRAQRRRFTWSAYDEFLRRHPLPRPRITQRAVFVS